jgi:nickel-dependent lactate racemase
MNLFGLVFYISIDKSKYDLVVVDDYTRITWVKIRDPKNIKEILEKGLK